MIDANSSQLLLLVRKTGIHYHIVILRCNDAIAITLAFVLLRRPREASQLTPEGKPCMVYQYGLKVFFWLPEVRMRGMSWRLHTPACHFFVLWARGSRVEIHSVFPSRLFIF